MGLAGRLTGLTSWFMTPSPFMGIIGRFIDHPARLWTSRTFYEYLGRYSALQPL
jgi:hypothetical protein